MSALFELPVRLAHDGLAVGGTVIAGAPGGFGDAGWAVIYCADRDDALSVMRDYPAARMPCWSRIESAGEVTP